MKFTEEELEKIKKERMEQIDRWLDNEYGCSYTHLEELHNFVIEQDIKHQEEKDKEIKRLQDEVITMRKLYFEIKDRNNKAIEYIKPMVELDNDIMMKGRMLKPVLEILEGENNVKD